ncbi:MAG: CopG family transcriptional regulator [Actinobacteria bacterium]|nr:CopG family transcriptional regulator [Actinomycetota bacterium]MBL7123481.1 CopG family transcriptional regulator [Actinomycetota bacterium]
MPRKTKILNISLSKELYKEIENIAKGESRTKSELIREAFRQYYANKKWSEIRAWGNETARRFGIKDEQDIDKILHEK